MPPPPAWSGVRVNVGQATTGFFRLLARVEAGENVEIARDGLPVARLVRVKPCPLAGRRFLEAHGAARRSDLDALLEDQG